MAQQTPPVMLTTPSGKQVPLPLTKAEPGIWRASTKAGELGLYRATDGVLSTVTAAGPLNPKEVADMRATTEVLQPVADTTRRQHALAGRRRSGSAARGARATPPAAQHWIGLRSNGALSGHVAGQGKAAPQWLALLLIVGALLLAWRLEGR